MNKKCYTDLKKGLGEADAISEYTEVMLRYVLEDEGTELNIEEASKLYGIRVNDVSESNILKKIRKGYIISVYQQFEIFLANVKVQLSKYGNVYAKRQDKESLLKHVYKNVFDMIQKKTDTYLLFCICEYYRMIRNYSAHYEDIKKLNNAYNELLEKEDRIKELFPKLDAPQKVDNIGFDDFILYSRCAKRLGYEMIMNIDYDVEKLAEEIDINKFKKMINSPERIEASLSREIEARYMLPSCVKRKLLTILKAKM